MHGTSTCLKNKVCNIVNTLTHWLSHCVVFFSISLSSLCDKLTLHSAMTNIETWVGQCFYFCHCLWFTVWFLKHLHLASWHLGRWMWLSIFSLGSGHIITFHFLWSQLCLIRVVSTTQTFTSKTTSRGSHFYLDSYFNYISRNLIF